MNIRGRIAIERIPTPKLVSRIVVLRTLRNTPIVGHCVLDGVVTFLQDRAIPVEPADMILMQRPLGVEGDVRIGGDFSLVDIGRSGAVSFRVPTGEVIVRAGEGVGGQGGRLVGLHGLRAHGSLAAVGVEGDDRVLRPLGVEGGVLGQIYGCFIRISRTAAVCLGIPALEVVALTGEGVCIQCRILLCSHSLRRHRALDRVFLAAVGLKGDGQLSRLFAAPDAVDIVDGVAGLGGRSLKVGTVCVVQLGGGDGDGHCIIAICIILMGCGLLAGCALLNVLAGAVAGADVRTALGGVDGANSRYAAVHIHLRINQVVIGAVVCLTRRIGHGLKLAGAPDKVVGVPLIAVIEIDALPVCNCQASALRNIDLNARQQSRILIDGHIAGLDIDGDVVGDGQYISCRVNANACKL